MTGAAPGQILTAVMADREYDALTISPDGAVCGWVGRHGGTIALYARDLSANGTPHGEPRILHAGPDLRGYVFLHDGQHVFLLLDDTGGENTRAALVPRGPGCPPDPQDGRPLTPQDAQCRLLAHRAAHPETVLIGLNLRDPAFHDVYALDTTTRATTLIAQNPGYAAWIIDQQGTIRGGIRAGDDASVTICLDAFSGTSATGPHPALEWRIPARRASCAAVLGLVPGDGHDVLWLLEGREPDSSIVTELHLLPSGAQPGRSIASPPGSEFHGAWTHPATGAPTILEYGRWSSRYLPLDAAAATDLRRLRAALRTAGLLPPGTTVDADRRDQRADRLWAVHADPGTGSPHAAIWDRRTGHLHDFGPQLPERDALAPVSTTAEEFTARDQAALPGYVTVAGPAATFPAQPPPAVVLVHGGPWERDRAGWDAETTALALSGYAVIRVNFRGSAGFGPGHLAAGNRQWGRAMSDDLDDAVISLARQGRIDAGRVAIMGTSYGGYAALIAACRRGFPYRCAIAAMAPTDLALLIEQIPDYWAPLRSLLIERIGDPQADAAYLAAVSPARLPGHLDTPVLLAYGEHDPRVPPGHIALLRQALAERDIDHEVLGFADEGHGLRHVENRLRYYRAALAFLARHLNPRRDPGGPRR